MARRVDLPCSMTGFTPPPVALQMKLRRDEDHWSLIALTSPGKPPKVARWLEQYGPASIYVGAGLSPRVLRAKFEELPGKWEEILDQVNLQFAQLTPEGAASLFVEDTNERVQQFVAYAKNVGPEEKVRARKSHVESHPVELTPRQLEVLQVAVALGYYEVPHKLNLRTLAEKLNLSVGAVSELLRRGEALIITSYIDSISKDRWESEASTEPTQVMEPSTPFDRP